MLRTQSQSQSKAAPYTSRAPLQAGLLQRKCACGQHTNAGGECEGCSKKSLSLQGSTRNSELGTRNSDGVPPIVHQVLNLPGQSLDAPTRSFMEARFGHDFSQVRVHSGGEAEQSAREVNALAYTVGRDIVFGAGRYSPHTVTGKRLLAHELTHVIQQGNRDALQRNLEIGPQDDAFERQADEMAARVCGTEDFTSSSPFDFQSQLKRGNTIQRAVEQPVPKPVEPPQPEPPIDCTKEITPDRDCVKLIGEMIALASEMRENERWLKELNDALKEDWQSVPLDVWAARTKLGAELKEKYDALERIRAACCPTDQVPPEAPTYVPPASP